MTATSPHHQFFKEKIAHWDAYRQRLAMNPTPPTQPRVPLKNATAEQRKAEKKLRASQHALAMQTAGFKGVAEFAEPLLQQALQERFPDLTFDIRNDQLVLVTRELDGLGPLHRYEVEPHSLLMAALQNFGKSESFTDDSALAPAGAFEWLAPPEGRLAFSLAEVFSLAGRYDTPVQGFIDMCRELDLGAAYQAHLDTVFKAPATAAGGRQAHLQVLRDQLAFDLAGADELEGLRAGIAAYAKGGASALVCSQLMLLDAPLFDVVVFSAADRNRDPRCAVWFPGAESAALKAYPSTADFVRQLHSDMAQQDYRAALIQRVGTGLRGEFSERLEGIFAGDKPRVLIAERAVAGDLFPWLYQLGQQRLRDEALALAVPVARVDVERRLQTAKRVFALGLDVLNVAGLFVPALNAVLGAYAAAQLMDQVFTGIEAWEQGDSAEALAHLGSVAANIAFVAVAGAVVTNAPAVLPSPVVDALVPVALENGETRLWRPDLEDYVSETPLPDDAKPDAMGQYAIDGTPHIRIDGQLYEQGPASDGWRIEHPTRRSAYRPALLHNGDGAWYLAHETPHTWNAERLMTRLGHKTDGFSAPELEQIRQASGIELDALRGLYADNRRVPALLDDTLARFRADRIAAGRGANADAFARAYAEFNHVPGTEAALLMRDFGGLTGRAAEEILAGANDLEREWMSRSQRVPLRLAEAARIYQRDLRLNAARSGLFLATPASVDSDRLLLAMLEHQPGWSGKVRVELRDGGIEGPLLGAAGGAAASEVKIVVREAQGYQPYDAQGHPLQRGTRLSNAVLAALPDAEREALNFEVYEGERLHQHLREQVLADRSRAGRALGFSSPLPWFRPVVRQPSGLVGYELSGRGWFGRSPANRLRVLYPRMLESDFEVFTARYGQDLELAATRLETEFRVLTRSLDEWVDAPATYTNQHGENATVVRDSRVEVARRLTAAWRRETLTAAGPRGAYDGVLDLGGLRVGRLPLLTADMSHVQSLVLDEMVLSTDPSDFLTAFTGLRRLTLRHNLLREIPMAVARMPELTSISLQGNQLRWGLDLLAPLRGGKLRCLILSQNDLQMGAHATAQIAEFTGLAQLALDATGLRLTAEDCVRLVRLKHLQSLTLAANAITLDAEGAAALSGLTALKTLDLRANPLGEAPDVSRMTNLQTLTLGQTGLTQWPPGLTQLMGEATALRTVHLDGNPIADIPDLKDLAFGASRLRSPRDYTLLIDDNDLTADSLRHLRAIGVRPSNQAPVADWLEGCPADVEHWASELRQDVRASDFFAVLDKVSTTRDYQNQPQAMQQRLWKLLEAMSAPQPGEVGGLGLEDLREQVFSLAEAAEATCGDAVILTFNRFETALQMYQELADVVPGLEQSLMRIVLRSRRLYTANVLDECAVAITDARIQRRAVLFPDAAEYDLLQPWQPSEMITFEDDVIFAPSLHPTDTLSDENLVTPPDEAELRLQLRLRLKEDLDLPPQPGEALYGDWVDDAMEQRVQRYVREQLSRERMANWLVDEAFWYRALYRYAPAPFEQATELWNSGFEYLYEVGRGGDIQPVAGVIIDALQAVLPEKVWLLDGQPQQVELNPTEYDAAEQWLKAARDRATRALVRTHTDRLVGMITVGGGVEDVR
jgi:hypothetical protein